MTPVLIEACEDTDAMFDLARKEVVLRGLAVVGDRIVVTAGAPLWQPGSTNLLKVIELEETSSL